MYPRIVWEACISHSFVLNILTTIPEITYFREFSLKVVMKQRDAKSEMEFE